MWLKVKAPLEIEINNNIDQVVVVMKIRIIKHKCGASVILGNNNHKVGKLVIVDWKILSLIINEEVYSYDNIPYDLDILDYFIELAIQNGELDHYLSNIWI